MPSRFMLYVGHITGFVIIMFGIWWVMGNISGLPEYKLVAALAALTGLVLNHFRWWRLSSLSENREIIQKMNHLVISNYVVLLLICVMLDI